MELGSEKNETFKVTCTESNYFMHLYNIITPLITEFVSGMNSVYTKAFPLKETMANEDDPIYDGAENKASSVVDHEELNRGGPEL